MKRWFDILFALAGLGLLAVPFAVIGLATKLSSRGPVFYRQLRIGRGGKPFWLYKFRTMYVDGRWIVSHCGRRSADHAGWANTTPVEVR